MIKETSLQSDVIEAVVAYGGMANKMSNRFMIGVADLLIKLPDSQAMIVEVKKNVLPVKSSTVKLDVTKLQERYLCDYAACGMPAGVMSFVLGKKRKMWVQLISIQDAMALSYELTTHPDKTGYAYHEIKLGLRGMVILQLLREFSDNHRRATL